MSITAIAFKNVGWVMMNLPKKNILKNKGTSIQPKPDACVYKSPMTLR
jgi:hypothetical protein